MATLRSRLKRGWDAFLGREVETSFSAVDYGPSYSFGSYKIQSYNYGNMANASRVIKNKIANDAAQIKMVHSIVDENGDYLDTYHSDLNYALNVRANIDQPATAFREDIYESLLEEGGIAIVPILIEDENEDPENDRREFEVKELRTARIVKLYPKKVRIDLFNEETGLHQEYTIDKEHTAIVENPFRSIMNDANSTARRLEKKLSLLDRIDEQVASGKLDLIIQLPYPLKGQKQKDDADRRRTELARQLEGSTYGVAYLDVTEKIVQLNRPLDNNLISQIEYYEKRLYTELGVTPEILNGTADEQAMINYHNRLVAPVVTAVAEAMMVAFFTKDAILDGQAISYFRDPFKLAPISQIAEIADKFTRNEIMTSNEIRAKIGLKPSTDPNADKLINSNLNHPDEGANVPNVQDETQEPT